MTIFSSQRNSLYLCPYSISLRNHQISWASVLRRPKKPLIFWSMLFRPLINSHYSHFHPIHHPPPPNSFLLVKSKHRSPPWGAFSTVHQKVTHQMVQNSARPRLLKPYFLEAARVMEVPLNATPCTLGTHVDEKQLNLRSLKKTSITYFSWFYYLWFSVLPSALRKGMFKIKRNIFASYLYLFFFK